MIPFALHYVNLVESFMDRSEVEPQETSGLARFVLPQGASVPPVSAYLLKDFDAAVDRESFNYEPSPTE
jgi:hypothetical protein